MPYQNNNNRIVPKEVLNVELKPAASPVDKELKYQPDITKAKEMAATTDALAKLGQGVADLDFLLKRKAEDSILAAEIETQAKGQNQQDWRAVSKNVKGMAKFNPYIKDAYRAFTSKNIESMAKIKIASNPNILSGKWDSQQVEKYLQEATNELMTAYSQLGLQPKDYSEYLEDYHNTVNKVREHYTVKNAEYTYNNSKTAMAHDGAIQMFNAVTSTEQGTIAEQITAGKDVINNVIKNAEAVGIPADEIGKDVLGVMLSEFVMQNPDKVNSEQLTAIMSGITVYGKDLNEVIPNYAYQLHQVLLQAREAHYQDRSYELKNRKLEIEIGQMDANKDLYNFLTKNPHATAPQMAEKIKEVVDKYGLEDVGLDLLKGGLSTQNSINDLMLNISDPSVVTHLSTLATTGDLTSDEINAHLKNGTLGLQDALKLTNLMNSGIKKDMTEINNYYKQITDKLKNKQYGTTLTNKETQDLQMRADSIIDDLNNGKITREEAADKMKSLNTRAMNMTKIKKGQAGSNLLINGSYLRSQSTPTYSLVKEKKALKQLGFVRWNNGFSSDKITDAYDAKRTRKENGKTITGTHKGVDVLGSEIRNTHTSGKVESAGYLSDLGNYVIIKYPNGNMVRIGHMAGSTKHLQGRVLQQNEYIGQVGNTGSSSRGSHADIRFMNSSGVLINAEQFRKGLF